MIRRILVALDDSPRAPHVLERAVEAATAFRASVRVFHAVAVPQDFPAAAHTNHHDLVPAFLRELAMDRLARLIATEIAGTHGLVCAVSVTESHRPADAILEEAESYDADIILVGSHGYAGWDRVLGTTTTKVVNRSRRDVWVVRHPALGA